MQNKSDDKLTLSIRESFKAFFVDTLDEEELAESEERGVITRKPATKQEIEDTNFKSSPPAYGDAIADADGRQQ